MANLNRSLQQNPPASMLLSTKLHMPLQKPNLVIRQALIDRLNQGLQHNTGLFLISAPAGYGKTTLVSEWLNSEPFHHTWLSLDEKDNDPVRFLSYLLAAIRKFTPEAGQASQSLFGLPQLPPVDVLVTPLINDLAVLNERLIIIFDDYHLIHNRYIHDIIQFILDYRPSMLPMVLITREDPPLTLAKMRAGGIITEIRANDLRFSEQETAAFMTNTMNLNLENEAVTLLTAMTEGWIVGLQLAALSLQGHSPEEIDHFIVNFSGSNQYIIDYLVSEVLDNLAEENRDFLRQTAVLDRFCAPLCNAITGREDSRQLLELLKRSNLFLFPLDEERQWYRYHHLFADSLRKGLGQEEQQAIHRKAAHWYEANGYLEEAVDHAIAATDYQEAGRLIYLAGEEIVSNGRLMTLIGWLDTLSDDFVCNSGTLALIKMYILYFLGQIEAIEPYFTVFENDFQAQTSALNRGRFYIIRSVLAASREEPQAVQLAKEALELVRGSNNDHLSALNTYGFALRSAGNLIEAIKVFREAFDLKQKLGYNFLIIHALNFLLSSLELNGRLSEAIRLSEDVLAEMTDHHSNQLPLARVVYLPLGVFYYNMNKLEQALEYSVRGIDICRKLAINRLVNGEYLLARVYGALGDSKKALLTIREAIREINPSVQPLTAFENTALEAELLLRQGEIKPAIDWAECWKLSPADKPGFFKEQSYFTYVRLLLAQERMQEAFTMLEYLESSIKSGQRFSRLITVHILQSLTYNRQGDGPKSLQYLAQALKLAAPEGYYRPFLDEGPSIAAMLPKAQVVSPEFVLELLMAFSNVPSTGGLIDPLSNRELELLLLVAAGFSNKEIARELDITVGTAKWHVHNILQKLGVNSRAQAIIKAKELHLFKTLL